MLWLRTVVLGNSVCFIHFQCMPACGKSFLQFLKKAYFFITLKIFFIFFFSYQIYFWIPYISGEFLSSVRFLDIPLIIIYFERQIVIFVKNYAKNRNLKFLLILSPLMTKQEKQLSNWSRRNSRWKRMMRHDPLDSYLVVKQHK